MKHVGLKYCLKTSVQILLLFVFSSVVFGSGNENVTISAKNISLGNAVTANPPGAMSSHVNPAGLSLMDEGRTIDRGYTFVRIVKTGSFKADPDWEGLHETWGPSSLYNPEDPLRQHSGPDPLDGTEGTNSHGIMYVPIPAIGALSLPILMSSTTGIVSRKKGSPWTFAYTLYAPHGGGIKHADTGDPMIHTTASVLDQHFVYCGPAASYKVSDTLSLGITMPIAQRTTQMKVYMRSPNMLANLTRVIGDATRDLDIPVISAETYPAPFFGGGIGPYESEIKADVDMRDDFVPSFNLGLLWSPKQWFTLGVCYQGESVAEQTGKYRFTYSDQYQKTVDWSGSTPQTLQSAAMLDNPYRSVPYQEGTVYSERKIPQFVNIGTMFRPIPKLKLMVDYRWGNWGANQVSKIYFDQRIQPLRSAKYIGYQHSPDSLITDTELVDTWHWSAGVEYQLKDHLKLRCGIDKRPTSEQVDLLGGRSMWNGSTLYGAGLEIKKPDGKKIELAVGMFKMDDFNIPNNTSTSFNSTDFTQFGNAYTGLDYSSKAAIYLISIGVTKPIGVSTSKPKGPNKIKQGLKKLKKLFKKLNPFSNDAEPNLDQHKEESEDDEETFDKEFDDYLDSLSMENE